MLRHGELLGAFTTNSRELASEEGEVLALASDPQARIEVRSAAAQTREQRAEAHETEAEARMTA